MDSATNPGIKTSEFYTMLITNVVAFALAHGWITATTAASATGNATTIGAVLLFVVGNAGYILTRFFLKMRLGVVPTLPTGLATNVAPVSSGPVSPSYGPPSTGPSTSTTANVETTPLPSGVI